MRLSDENSNAWERVAEKVNVQNKALEGVLGLIHSFADPDHECCDGFDHALVGLGNLGLRPGSCTPKDLYEITFYLNMVCKDRLDPMGETELVELLREHWSYAITNQRFAFSDVNTTSERIKAAVHAAKSVNEITRNILLAGDRMFGVGLTDDQKSCM